MYISVILRHHTSELASGLAATVTIPFEVESFEMCIDAREAYRNPLCRTSNDASLASGNVRVHNHNRCAKQLRTQQSVYPDD